MKDEAKQKIEQGVYFDEKPKVKIWTYNDPTTLASYFILDSTKKLLKKFITRIFSLYKYTDYGWKCLRAEMDSRDTFIADNRKHFNLSYFNVEDHIAESVVDEAEELKDEDLFRFFVEEGQERSKHENKYSRYFVKYKGQFYSYDADIGNLLKDEDDSKCSVPFKSVSYTECLDAKNCMERIREGKLSPKRDIDVEDLSYNFYAYNTYQRNYFDNEVYIVRTPKCNWYKCDTSVSSNIKIERIDKPNNSSICEISRTDCKSYEEALRLVKDADKLMKDADDELSPFTFFEYKPLQYPNYKSLNHIWIWDDRDKLWFRYDKYTDELLNAYESIAVQDMPDNEELQKCLMNKELEDKIIERINNMTGEKGICYSVSKEDLERQKEKNALFDDWKNSMDAKENNIEDYIFFTDRLGRKTIVPDTSLESKFDYIWIHSVKDDEWWLYNTKNSESQILKKDFDYECALGKLGTDELSMNEKRQIVNSIKTPKVKYNCGYILDSKKCKKEENMPPTMNKVKVVPKSEKYTRTDIEQALNEAYDDYNYVLDFKKEDDEFVYLYFKEKEIS